MSTPVQANGHRTPFGNEQIRDLPWVKVIPYDHVAEFPITGEVGRVVQDVINVSAEGVFVAVSIGYGFEEDRVENLELINAGDKTLGNITLNDFPPDALIEGFRINPRYEAVAVRNNGALEPEVAPGLAASIFQRIKPASDFSFLLSIVDSASGRELQNKPIHSVATLGSANGRRPFKALSQPMVFMPRSTIRFQVEESTRNVSGRLFITLQGYKVLGISGNLDDGIRRLVEMDPLKKIPVYDYSSGNFRTLGEAMERHLPTRGVVPFDYVSALELTGKPGNIVEDEIAVNVDGGYIALAMGYSLDPRDTRLELEGQPFDGRVSLGSIPLTKIRPVEALFDGIRIEPNKLQLAFNAAGLASVLESTAGRIFQRLNLPTDVRFLYSIIDAGTGRELQNQPVHNIAGLGIANGDRPFRALPRPIMFLPRSTIRVQVREISGRGRLFIVFQGYKMLG